MNHHNPIQELENEAKNIELRSEQVQEIIGTTPGVIIRTGSFSLLLFLTILMGIAWIIETPDFIEGSFTIYSTNPPTFVKAVDNGIIKTVYFKEGDTLREGSKLFLSEQEINASCLKISTRTEKVNKPQLLFNKNIHQTLLTSPVYGIVIYSGLLHPQQQVCKDDLLCIIKPLEKSTIYAKLLIPPEHKKKVFIGQPISLNLSFSRDSKLKEIETELYRLSSLVDSTYLGIALIPEKNIEITEYYNIPEHGQQGTYRVITGKRRIIDKILGVK